MTVVLHSIYITRRCVRNTVRQPAYLVIMLVQPLIWLAFFGGVFKQVVHIGDFPARDYLDYLAPGVVVMSALFSGGINGTAMLRDINRGVIDGLLALPVRRSALILGRVGQQVVITLVQSTVVLIVAFAFGARLHGGVTGVVVLYGVAIVLGGAFAVASNAGALLLRKEETLSALINFVLFPAAFLSTVFMPGDAVAGWISAIARYNPVNWAAMAGRTAASADTDWPSVLSRAAYLIVFAAGCGVLAALALRSYRRSI